MNPVLLGSLFAVGLFLGTFLMIGVGRYIGAWQRAKHEGASRDGYGAIEGAMFGLLGLILANRIFYFKDFSSDFLGLGEGFELFHVMFDVRDDFVKQSMDKGGILNEAVKNKFFSADYFGFAD